MLFFRSENSLNLHAGNIVEIVQTLKPLDLMRADANIYNVV
jgi:hypothetical protein